MRTTFVQSVVIAVFFASATAIDTRERPTTNGLEDATRSGVARALRGALSFSEKQYELEKQKHTSSYTDVVARPFHEEHSELIRTAKALTP
ncbi:hypothetical protein CCR75_002280 [Bremia lactucae]|uniref:RxLR effector protein n=1 Tax=Bremia lactucae TaxID=4779 RepID=A0A976IET5_BRELC|nr:hypothetical protein CCR75_002280 [Bremia lactucae]